MAGFDLNEPTLEPDEIHNDEAPVLPDPAVFIPPDLQQPGAL